MRFASYLLVSSGDYQFFPPRMMELQQQEIYSYRVTLFVLFFAGKSCWFNALSFQKSLGYKIPKAPNDDPEAEAARVEEQEKIDSGEHCFLILDGITNAHFALHHSGAADRGG